MHVARKELTYFLCGEAINTIVYILNRCPIRALVEKTPIEAFSGRKPGIKHLKVFGCVCYSHIPSDLRHKLQESFVKGIFVGYGKAEKSCRIYNL